MNTAAVYALAFHGNKVNCVETIFSAFCASTFGILVAP